jgi:hypothetical protein
MASGVIEGNGDASCASARLLLLYNWGVGIFLALELSPASILAASSEYFCQAAWRSLIESRPFLASALLQA